jgi:hypothetical protein
MVFLAYHPASLQKGISKPKTSTGLNQKRFSSDTEHQNLSHVHIGFSINDTGYLSVESKPRSLTPISTSLAHHPISSIISSIDVTELAHRCYPLIIIIHFAISAVSRLLSII